MYLAEYDINSPYDHNTYASKAVYSKMTLRGIDSATLLKIAEDLEINALSAQSALSQPPRNWPDESKFRLFIIHLSDHKDKATRLRDCLAPFYISGFVAHQDIHPTMEWQLEIQRALFTMDAFLAIHTPGFTNSVWAQQEIGFAIAQGVKIISLKMGEDPSGFLSKHQASLEATAQPKKSQKTST